MAPESTTLPASFWDEVRDRPSRLLMLDYDGTLAAFRVARAVATVEPEILATLGAIASSGSTDLAVISGRPVVELERLLAPLSIHLIGEHGWEERTADGTNVLHPPPSAAVQTLEAMAQAALTDGWGDRVERKRCSLVLHTRGLDPEWALELERRCDEVWRATPGTGTRLAKIHGGRELRALGRDKGVAVSALMASKPPGTLPVYIGDDETDEDAFQVVAPRGHAIRVGGNGGRSSATMTLASPHEVGEFLQRWHAVTSGARTH
jgi:trehalose 6-phosphate phosphatase